MKKPKKAHKGNIPYRSNTNRSKREERVRYTGPYRLGNFWLINRVVYFQWCFIKIRLFKVETYLEGVKYVNHLASISKRS